MKKRLSELRCAWFLFFTLGVVMLNFPFIQTVNKDINVLGIPLTLLYFLVGWPFSILVIYLFSKAFIKHRK